MSYPSLCRRYLRACGAVGRSLGWLSIARAVLVGVLVLIGCGMVIRPEHRAPYPASYQVLVLCANGGGQMGSAVAVGPHELLTVRHMVTCEPGNEAPGEVIGVLVGYGGPEFTASVKAVSDDVDGATLKTDHDLGGNYAVPARGHAREGDFLCVITGKHFKKCGYVVTADDKSTWVALRGVHGNSGSPVYNEMGDLVGVLSRATMEYEVDDVVEVVNVGVLKDIL